MLVTKILYSLSSHETRRITSIATHLPTRSNVWLPALDPRPLAASLKGCSGAKSSHFQGMDPLYPRRLRAVVTPGRIA